MLLIKLIHTGGSKHLFYATKLQKITCSTKYFNHFFVPHLNIFYKSMVFFSTDD